jgi:CxxC motif-containing protein (DUF1111 family)
MEGLKLTTFFLFLAAFACWLLPDAQMQSIESQLKSTSEAPAGYDDQTNGFVSQEFFNQGAGAFRKHFIDREGLGPVFNGESCTRCHQFPAIGGSGLILVTRAGKFDGKNFIPHVGGMVIQTNALPPQLRESQSPEFNVTTHRMPTSALGDGFIEAIDDDTIRAFAAKQRKLTGGKIAGDVIDVPILEAPGKTRVGRFGWKNSHASLVSFVAEALLNEIGITSPFFPNENTSNGKSVAAFDKAPDPEVDRARVELIANFIRATKTPDRVTQLAKDPVALEGEKIFAAVGCAICHIPSMKTAPVGRLLNGGTLKVPEALGDKTIRPYSDFLLHDIGTGDGIVETNNPNSRNKIRSAPLWGLGVRVERLCESLLLMHDGSARSIEEAVKKHSGEAAAVIDSYNKLPEAKRHQLIKFLKSL